MASMVQSRHVTQTTQFADAFDKAFSNASSARVDVDFLQPLLSSSSYTMLSMRSNAACPIYDLRFLWCSGS
jgi:hypothetical protein